MGNRQTNKMFWKIDKLNVFFLPKHLSAISDQYFDMGSRGGHRGGGG